MKYYLKQGFFPFVYQIFMVLISFGILAIKGAVWIKIILAVLDVAIYLIIVASVAYREGQNSIKVRTANDLERMEIIRTGEDRPLKLHEEYKPWKGFTFGFLACVPIMLLLLLHTIIYNATGSSWLGVVAGFIGLMFFIFFRLDTPSSSAETTTVPWYTYYGTLISLPLIMLTMGIAYILGAKKIMRQQEMIQEKQRQIYGDKV